MSTPSGTLPSGRYNAAVDLVDRHLDRPDRTAYIDSCRTLSFGALASRTVRFAGALDRLGIRREERVVLLLLDTVDFPVVFWGAIRAGVVPVPVNPLLSAEQWRYVIEDSRAAADLVPPGHRRELPKTATGKIQRFRLRAGE